MNSTYYCPCDGPSWSGGSTYPYSSGAGGGQETIRWVTNNRRISWEEVKLYLDTAVRDLNSEAGAQGATTNAATLTSGLGGDSTVWKSPLAESVALKLQEAIKKVDGRFVKERDQLGMMLGKEPEKVREDDIRAKVEE